MRPDLLPPALDECNRQFLLGPRISKRGRMDIHYEFLKPDPLTSSTPLTNRSFNPVRSVMRCGSASTTTWVNPEERKTSI